MVLYRNQWPVIFFLHFAKLHIGSSIRIENTLFKIILSNIILSKEVKYPSIVFLSIYITVSQKLRFHEDKRTFTETLP